MYTLSKLAVTVEKRHFYSAFTEIGATQKMKTNQMTELEQQIPTFSNQANRV